MNNGWYAFAIGANLQGELVNKKDGGTVFFIRLFFPLITDIIFKND